MQNKEISRIQQDRRRRNRQKRLRMAVKTVMEGVITILMIISAGCMAGIGFGLGITLFLTWI